MTGPLCSLLSTVGGNILIQRHWWGQGAGRKWSYPPQVYVDLLQVIYRHLNSKLAWISEFGWLADRGGHTVSHACTRVTFPHHKALRIRSDIVLFCACALWAPKTEGTLLGLTKTRRGELHNFHCLRHIEVFRPGRRAGHDVCHLRVQEKFAWRIWVEKSDRKGPLGRPRHRWRIIYKLNLKTTQEFVHGIYLVCEWNRRLAVMLVSMNIQVI